MMGHDPAASSATTTSSRPGGGHQGEGGGGGGGGGGIHRGVDHHDERALVGAVLDHAHFQRYGATRAAGEELCVPFSAIEASIEACAARDDTGSNDWGLVHRVLVRLSLDSKRDWWGKLGGVGAAARREKMRCSSTSLSSSSSMPLSSRGGAGQRERWARPRAEVAAADGGGVIGGAGGAGKHGVFQKVAAVGKENNPVQSTVVHRPHTRISTTKKPAWIFLHLQLHLHLLNSKPRCYPLTCPTQQPQASSKR